MAAVLDGRDPQAADDRPRPGEQERRDEAKECPRRRGMEAGRERRGYSGQCAVSVRAVDGPAVALRDLQRRTVVAEGDEVPVPGPAGPTESQPGS